MVRWIIITARPNRTQGHVRTDMKTRSSTNRSGAALPMILTVAAVAIAALAGYALAQAVEPATKPGPAATTGPAGAWPCYRGANRDGISDQKDWNSDWSKAPAKLWDKEVGVGYSAVAAVGDRIYTMGNAKGSDTV